MRVSTTLVIVFATLLAKASAAEDLYWEGEDEANEFLEVDQDTGIGGHLRRLKRDWPWNFFQTTTSDPEETATEDDELIDDESIDNDLNGGSGAIGPEYESEKEKTLRVTFVVMEPYDVKYSNRDSPQFQNFSKSLAEAVNTVFRDLQGTHRASLVRIQSRPAEEFSCKVTLDIVVTGDDTDRISETLRDYIRNKRRLGDVSVNDDDYSATVIDSGYVDNEVISQSEDQYNVPERGDGIPETTELPDLLEPDEDQIFGERPIGVDESETTEEIRPDEGGNDYESHTEDTSLNERRTDYLGPDNGRTTEGRPDEGTNEYERPDYSRPSEGRPDDGRNVDGKPDSGRPSEEIPENRGQGGYELYTETPGGWRNNTCPDDAMNCDVTRCVPLSQRCDDQRDCDDGADEMGCPDKSCGTDDFRCNNGKCIENARRCNRQNDCPGGEDEMNCNCRSDEFRCLDDGSCIEDRKRCNGNNECRDGSDELNCAIGYFKCRTGKLIPEHQRCNRHYDCDPGDYSDERNCPCGDGDFKCDNGYCIPANKKCDRTHDCQDGSDERDCTYGLAVSNLILISIVSYTFL